jgi:hypothetical protein
MAQFKADLRVVVATDHATAVALKAQVQAFLDACTAAGGDVRGNGIDIRRDEGPSSSAPVGPSAEGEPAEAKADKAKAPKAAKA